MVNADHDDYNDWILEMMMMADIVDNRDDKMIMFLTAL